MLNELLFGEKNSLDPLPHVDRVNVVVIGGDVCAGGDMGKGVLLCGGQEDTDALGKFEIWLKFYAIVLAHKLIV